jgi:hypothetical protein
VYVHPVLGHQKLNRFHGRHGELTKLCWLPLQKYHIYIFLQIFYGLMFQGWPGLLATT